MSKYHEKSIILSIQRRCKVESIHRSLDKITCVIKMSFSHRILFVCRRPGCRVWVFALCSVPWKFRLGFSETWTANQIECVSAWRFSKKKTKKAASRTIVSVTMNWTTGRKRKIIFGCHNKTHVARFIALVCVICSKFHRFEKCKWKMF